MKIQILGDQLEVMIDPDAHASCARFWSAAIDAALDFWGETDALLWVTVILWNETCENSSEKKWRYDEWAGAPHKTASQQTSNVVPR